MKVKVDLHVHTVRSPDAVTRLKDALTIAKAKGMDGIALTDHDVTTRLEGEDLLGLMVIPGIEVRTKEAHILGLDIEGKIGKPRTASEAVKVIHDHGGVAVLAHPYASILGFKGRRVVGDMGLDAIEVFNSGTPFFRLSTLLAWRLARSLNLPATGGSDSHIPETVGSSYTVFECDFPRVPEVLEALRSGRTEPFGKPITLSQRLKKLWLTGHRQLEGSP